VYTEFFGLNDKPFAITPDPRYLYMSQRHADALAHLVYGVSESGGFIQLTGEVGTGKTTLIRSLLEQLPEKAEIALILNPQLTRHEFLQAICEELRVTLPAEDTIKALIDALNRHLLAAHAEGRRIVLIVDEAQTLSAELLEQVRLLTNLETAKQKLLQIILIGQPELRDLLAQRNMRQIAQRVTGRYHLEPLTWEDTQAYVRHRMRVAGAQADVFAPSAIREIYRRSGGVPRLINVIADRALLAAYSRDRSRVDGSLVRQAAVEVFGARSRVAWLGWTAAAVGALAVAAIAWPALWQQRSGVEREASAAPVAAVSPREADRQLDADFTTVVAAQASPPPFEPATADLEPVRLAALFADPALRFDTDAAVHELFALWGIAYEPEAGTPCEQAEAQGLRCLIETAGSISQLRRINRPSILSLRGEGGIEYQVVLSALGFDMVELATSSETFNVSLADLTHHWYGDHLLLWRPELADSRALVPGRRDDGVLWLRDSLARILAEPIGNAGSTLFDPQLEARVREYQRDRMLTVDGIVGAKTQIALTTDLAAPDTPWLRKNH
jgi:general secretion pathway protein A